MNAFKYKLLYILATLAASCLQVTHSYEIEMGSVVVQDTFASQTWTSVTFSEPFDTVPVVAVLPTTNGGDPMTLRIRNVTTTGFQVVQTEPDANDGQHLLNETAYIAAEVGSHRLPDGRTLHVERRTVSNNVGLWVFFPSWQTVSFPAGSFSTTPAVIAQIQTMDGELRNPPATSSSPFLDVAARNVSPAGFEVSLEQSETFSGFVFPSEQVGIIALSANTQLSFVDNAGVNTTLMAFRSNQNVRGYSNGCRRVRFPQRFLQPPLIVASMNTRNSQDGGWVRICGQSASNASFTIDEDIDFDTERSHPGERLGIIAASNAFHADFGVGLSIRKTTRVTADPFNNTSQPKSIPNADVRYTIFVENQGLGTTDNDSVVIIDTIPPNLRLCVLSSCLTGGPVVFDSSGSAVPPGVTLNSVEYSNNNGASFSYTPTADADGFDNAVNAIRINMSGIMNGRQAGGVPSFELQLAARVN